MKRRVILVIFGFELKEILSNLILFGHSLSIFDSLLGIDHLKILGIFVKFDQNDTVGDVVQEIFSEIQHIDFGYCVNSKSYAVLFCYENGCFCDHLRCKSCLLSVHLLLSQVFQQIVA